VRWKLAERLVDHHCSPLLVTIEPRAFIEKFVKKNRRYAPVENLTVQYATTEISDGFDGPRTVGAEMIIPHEDYNGNLIKDDIGLVKLKAPLNNQLHDSPVKLSMPGNYYRTGTKTTVAGWGRLGSGLPISTVLQKVDLQIYSYEDCKAAHDLSSSSLDIYPTNICAGVPEMGKAECNGDSGEIYAHEFIKRSLTFFLPCQTGGPLLVDDVLVGIVSWSIKPCAVAPYPGVYTDVSNYIDWIKKHTGIEFQLKTFLIRN
jgi:trypsin